MATVSDEVHRRDTPLRQLLVPLQPTIDGWRQAVAAKLDGRRTIRPGHEGCGRWQVKVLTFGCGTAQTAVVGYHRCKGNRRKVGTSGG